MAKLVLSHSHIAKALLDSEDNGETLNLTKGGYTEVSEASAEELANIGITDPQYDVGIVTRIALGHNHLSSLPQTFRLLARLRYLNLRQNAFTSFPYIITQLPSLEILDISRNTITALPPHPGNLKNLRVFSIAKNQVRHLPAYISQFHNLRVLKVESNPISWPPQDVWERVELDDDDDEHMEEWINQLQSWMSSNREVLVEEENEPHDNSNSEDEVILARSHLARSDSNVSSISRYHTRTDSMDSQSSVISLNSPRLEEAHVPFMYHHNSSLGSFQSHDPSTSNSRTPYAHGASDENSVSQPQHSRGASYSVGERHLSNRQQTLMNKKSLPDLRSRSFSLDKRGASRQRKNSRALDSSGPRQSDHTTLSGANTPMSTKSENDATPIDDERNLYFRRFSTLPKPSESDNVPIPLLNIVDSIRGILFSLSQIYSAVRNYTVSAIDERTSGVLSKVLDPASSYLSGLINALDQFDSMSELGGAPPPSTCRSLIESCKDNVAVFGKVAGVLQLQLKVLSSSHDSRYTRTLLLMLYGSMAEISNSWQAMTPHLQLVIPLLRERRTSNLASNVKARSASGRFDSSPTDPVPSAPVNGTATRPNQPPRAAVRSRRHAGSFSSNDVQIGRALASHSPTDRSHSTSAHPLRSALRQPGGFSISTQASVAPSSNSPTLSHQYSHSRGESQSFISAAVASSPTPGLSASPHLASGVPHSNPYLSASRGKDGTFDMPSDSSKLVDQDFMDTVEAAADDAQAVWSILEEVLVDDAHPNRILRESLDKAQLATDKIKTYFPNAREHDSEALRRAFGEDARSFVTFVAQTLVQLKNFAILHTVSSDLRDHAAKLAQAMRDVTVFLHVSSFAPTPTPRPYSPAFSPSGEERVFALSRNRSATANTSKLSTLISREQTQSAQPQNQPSRLGP